MFQHIFYLSIQRGISTVPDCFDAGRVILSRVENGCVIVLEHLTYLD